MLTKIPHRLGNKNGDKKIYIISDDSPYSGLAPIIINVISYLRIAERKGYIPVIDLKYYLTLWTGTDKDVNAWEYYFTQPSKISVNEAYQSKRVYLSNPSAWDLKEVQEASYDALYNNKRLIKCYHKYFRKYCHYKEDLKQYIEQEKRKVLKKGRRILGCSIRMGHAQLQRENYSIANLHDRQPESLDVFLEDLNKYLVEWNCEYVFLSTDDAGSVEYLGKFLGEKLLYVKRNRVKRTENNRIINLDDMQSVSSTVDSVVKENYAYLAELEILSKCQCYLCGKSGGSRLVHVLNNNKFEHTYPYHLGLYEYKQKGK